MKGLEAELEDLVALDNIRKRARRLRAAAVKGIASRDYPVPGRITYDSDEDKSQDCKWEDSTDVVEIALLLSVERIAHKRSVPFDDEKERQRFASLREKLLGKRPVDASDDGALRESHMQPRCEDEDHAFLDTIPTLRCARLLHEFAARPRLVFDVRIILCHYRILLELYSTGHPDWVIGSARAADEGDATAFITNECVRAVLALRSSMEMTAQLCERIKRYREAVALADQVASFDPDPALGSWAALAKERAALSLVVDFLHLRRMLMFEAAAIEDVESFEGPADIDRFIESLATEAADQLRKGADNIEKALGLVATWRRVLSSTVSRVPREQERQRHLIERTESAHAAAQKMLQRGKSDLLEIAEKFESAPAGLVTSASAVDAAPSGSAKAPRSAKQWGEIADSLRAAAGRVRRTLRPSTAYMNSVLDREIAAYESPGAPDCDAPELVFAATGYGAITSQWGDPRLKKAAKILDEQLGEDGTLARGRAFHRAARGYMLHAAPGETIRAVARLFQMVDHPVSAASAEKLLRYYEQVKIPVKQGDDSAIVFCADERAGRNRASWWVSAIAVNALDRIVRMLNAAIKRRVRVHFTCKEWDQIKFDLGALVASDCALSLSEWTEPMRASANPKPLHVPIGHQLERMRAHLLDTALPDFERLGRAVSRPAWSTVLFGPPGTGKSTLMEALVKSAGPHFTFITVTPSDIVMGGAEEIEMRARSVMKALSMLTDCVVLFDEFDELIRRRTSAGDGQQRSVFQFITPGMLTKLSALYESSEENRVVYALATNWVGNLDEAAIRDGRFDVKIGVYPPDPLSRLGSLVASVLWAREKCAVGGSPGLTDDALKGRIADGVRLTALGPMTRLGRPGWLSRPKEALCKKGAKSEGTLFDYLRGAEEDLPAAPGREFDQLWGTVRHYEIGGRSPEWDLNEPSKPAMRELIELGIVMAMEDVVKAGVVSAAAPQPWDNLGASLRQCGGVAESTVKRLAQEIEEHRQKRKNQAERRRDGNPGGPDSVPPERTPTS